MASWTNESFLEDLDRDYPGVDWDAVPDAETFPDVFEVKGIDLDGRGWSIFPPFVSRQAAEDWIACRLHGTRSCQIVVTKPTEAIDMEIWRDLRKDILAGKKMFPMYLP